MDTEWNIKGKTVLVTGGTSGIGYEVAQDLAIRGAKVIVVGRNAERGQAAVEQIEQKAGKGKIIFIQADLSQLAEVHRLAEHITTHYPELQVLINNAAAMFVRRQLTAEGLEATLATDHLSPFLLTNLLLGLLKTNAPARIINVSSYMHRRATINFEDLQTVQDYKGLKAYGQAKLAGVLTTYELARHLEGSNIQVNLADPLGATSTGMLKDGNISKNFAGRIMLGLLSLILTTKRAARSTIYLATAPEAAGLNGKYVNYFNKVVASAPASYNEATARRVWEMSAELTGLKQESLNP